MTDRLDEIHRRLESGIYWKSAAYRLWAKEDIAYLLAEVESLRLQIESMDGESRAAAERAGA